MIKLTGREFWDGMKYQQQTKQPERDVCEDAIVPFLQAFGFAV
jgi:hypothetical protein